jgi:3-methylfumaryl-CoA hydratase
VAAPVAAPCPPVPEGRWTRVRQPDSRLLFRFSALAFSFRGVAPLFDLGPVLRVGTPEGDSVALQAQGPVGKAGLQASATLARAAGPVVGLQAVSDATASHPPPGT